MTRRELVKWASKQIKRARRAWRSWTVNWGLLLAVAGYFQDNLGQVMPFIHKIMPTEEAGLFVTFIGMVVVFLRFKTTKPLEKR